MHTPTVVSSERAIGVGPEQIQEGCARGCLTLRDCFPTSHLSSEGLARAAPARAVLSAENRSVGPCHRQGPLTPPQSPASKTPFHFGFLEKVENGP